MTGLYVCLNRGDVDPKSQQVYCFHSTFFFSVLVIVQKKNINELNILLYGILGSGVQRQLDVLLCPLLLITYFYALKMLVS